MANFEHWKKKSHMFKKRTKMCFIYSFHYNFGTKNNRKQATVVASGVATFNLGNASVLLAKCTALPNGLRAAFDKEFSGFKLKEILT